MSRKFFNHCDKDGSGEIDFPEFKSVLFACDPTSGNAFGFTPGDYLSPHDAFTHFDVDGSGTIDEDEFADILEYLKLSVNDFKQERLFRKYDIDGSGSIDYEEFKACWLDCVDVRTELRKRNVHFGKMTPTYALKKKLAKLVDEEEDMESKVLASADQNLLYGRTKEEKIDLFKRARARADEAITHALDAAGQVYVFGRGSHAQFRGEAYRHHFKDFSKVHDLWTKRVAPIGGSSDHRRSGTHNNAHRHRTSHVKKRDEKGKMVTETGVKSAAAEARERAEEMRNPEDDDESTGWVDPFLRVNTMVNTSFLWGRGIISVSIGESCAMCVDKDGHVYAWGGNDRWYRTAVDRVNETGFATTGNNNRAVDPQTPPLTARSKKMLSVVRTSKRRRKKDRRNNGEDEKRAVEEDEVVGLVNQEDSATKTEEEQRAKEERTLGDQLKIVLKYYGVWTPPPSNRLRLKHMEMGLLPKVTHAMLKSSLELRHKDCSNKTKLDLVRMLAKDLRFEANNDVQSKSLRRLEADLEKAIINSNVLKKREIRSTFEDVWGESKLFAKQIASDRDARAREIARAAAAAAQEEAEYSMWRENIQEQLSSNKKVYTPRGRNVKIPLRGFTTRGPVPEDSNAASTVRTVSVGTHHAALIHSDGSVYTWGEGSFGRLGLGKGDRSTARMSASHPTKIVALGTVKARRLSCGFSHSAIVSQSGQVLIWGSAVSGKLGIGTVAKEYECFCPMPHPVDIVSQTIKERIEVSEVSCGAAHTGVVTKDGHVYMWGCGDAGRLGLGLPIVDVYIPRRAKIGDVSSNGDDTDEDRRGCRAVQISCGASHTAILTSVQTQYQGKGVNRVERLVGGFVYMCGAATILPKMTPRFEKIDVTRNESPQVIRRISVGSLHAGLLSADGELFTFGSNAGGCAGHPTQLVFVPTPRIIRALYVAPHNMSRNKATRQSSTYAKRSSALAVNGKRSGKGERRCTHTQLDPQAWWEVDLGQLSVIERVIVWNRTDVPEDDSSHPRDEYTGRLFPFWIFISQTEFSDAVGGKSFAVAYRQSCEMKKFTQNKRKTMWNVPANTIGRYVRIQLEQQNYLHIAEVEVFGRTGTRVGVFKVDDVVCGNATTIATIKPRVDKHELESAYKTAVRADANAADVLRYYPQYFEMYDRHGRGGGVAQCSLCRGNTKCEICRLLITWPLSDKELEMVRHGKGPEKKRPGLDFIGKLIVDQNPPKLSWTPPKRRKAGGSEACVVS